MNATTPKPQNFRRPLSPLVEPSRGCQARPGRWTLRLSGAVACGAGGEGAGRREGTPGPLELKAALARLAPFAGGPELAELVIGEGEDPLEGSGAQQALALQAAVWAVDAGVHLRLVTRQAPGLDASSQEWAELLARAGRGAGATLCVRLMSTDPELAMIYEPAAPPPQRRLEAASRLGAQGVKIEARVEPLLPWLSDTALKLEPLAEALAAAGVRHVEANYLRVQGDDRRALAAIPAAHRALLRGCLRAGHQGEAGERLLPAEHRVQGYRRLERLLAARGLGFGICLESNPDLPMAKACGEGAAQTPRDATRHLARPRPAGGSSGRDSQPAVGAGAARRGSVASVARGAQLTLFG